MVCLQTGYLYIFPIGLCLWGPTIATRPGLRLWYHTSDEGKIPVKTRNQCGRVCWRYKDRKFLLWSAHALAGPIFPNTLTSLLDYKVFILHTFLTIYIFHYLFFKSFINMESVILKTWLFWENIIYYFNTFWIMYEVEVLFICLLIICISESWIFRSSVYFFHGVFFLLIYELLYYKYSSFI